MAIVIMELSLWTVDPIPTSPTAICLYMDIACYMEEHGKYLHS